MNSFIKKSDLFFLSIEKRFGLLFASFLISVMLIAAAMLYVQPNFELVFHGKGFSDLSSHPFDFHSGNELQFRILAPLLGYLLFLRGIFFFILPLLFLLFFISAVYFNYRRKNFSSTEAFAMASLMTFSTAVLIPLIAPGYTDTITFFFLFLSFFNIDRPYRSATFFSLALLNHESSLVLLPGLILYSIAVNKNSFAKILKSISAFVIACVPFLLYRWFVSLHTDVVYSTGFYFSKENISTNTKYLAHFLPAALFYAFKLFWFFPLYVILKMVKGRKFLFPFLICLIVSCATAQLIVAADYTRMVSFAFPAVLISAEKIREWWGTEKFVRFTFMLILFNFFILQYFVINEGLTALFPWIYNVIAALCGHPNV